MRVSPGSILTDWQLPDPIRRLNCQLTHGETMSAWDKALEKQKRNQNKEVSALASTYKEHFWTWEKQRRETYLIHTKAIFSNICLFFFFDQGSKHNNSQNCFFHTLFLSQHNRFKLEWLNPAFLSIYYSYFDAEREEN